MLRLLLLRGLNDDGREGRDVLVKGAGRDEGWDLAQLGFDVGFALYQARRTAAGENGGTAETGHVLKGDLLVNCVSGGVHGAKDDSLLVQYVGNLRRVGEEDGLSFHVWRHDHLGVFGLLRSAGYDGRCLNRLRLLLLELLLLKDLRDRGVDNVGVLRILRRDRDGSFLGRCRLLLDLNLLGLLLLLLQRLYVENGWLGRRARMLGRDKRRDVLHKLVAAERNRGCGFDLNNARWRRWLLLGLVLRLNLLLGLDKLLLVLSARNGGRKGGSSGRVGVCYYPLDVDLLPRGRRVEHVRLKTRFLLDDGRSRVGCSARAWVDLLGGE